MEALEELFFSAGSHWVEILIAVVAIGFVSSFSIHNVFGDGPESAIEFDIPRAPQCKPGWRGQELESPSIKVCIFSAGEEQAKQLT